MILLNPYFYANKQGIPRLEARNTPTADTSNNLTYDFYEHRFLNYPYAGIIIFKLPAVTAPAAAGNVYFTTGDNNSNILVLDAHGNNLSATDTNLAAGGVYLGWYAEGNLLLMTGV